MSYSSRSSGNLHGFFFSQVLNVASLGISLSCNSKYKFFLELLLQMSHFFCTFSFSCKQENYFQSDAYLASLEVSHYLIHEVVVD
jgi:hypothetical protein